MSADIDTYYRAESVYEVAWDGNFKASVRFGDGTFGKIPPKGAAIKVIYRVNDSSSYGYVVKPGEGSQTVRVKSVDVLLSNEFSSAPSTSGESLENAKNLAPRFFAAQDRAVSADDYIVLARRYNENFKIAATLPKSEARIS